MIVPTPPVPSAKIATSSLLRTVIERPMIAPVPIPSVPEPEIVEQSTQTGKIVTVSSPEGQDESLYMNVPVRIEIPEVFRV